MSSSTALRLVDQRVAGGLELRVLRLRQPIRHRVLDLADLDHGVVRFADLVADLDRELELLLQVRVGRVAQRMLAARRAAASATAPSTVSRTW